MLALAKSLYVSVATVILARRTNYRYAWTIYIYPDSQTDRFFI